MDQVLVTEGPVTALAETNGYLLYDETGKELTDLSICIIQQVISSGYLTDSSFVNLFTGNGIKLARYSKEIPLQVQCIDQSPQSCSLALRNFHENKLNAQITCMAVEPYLTSSMHKFSIIEMDPFKKNCPQFYPFIIDHLNPRGLLILTVPELGLISGNAYHEKCREIYGGTKLGKHSATIEAGIRLVLAKLQRDCTELNKRMKVLLCYSIKSRIKLFILLEDSNQVVSTLQKYWHCSTCDFITQIFQGNCNRCQTHLIESGPFYNGSLKDETFVSNLLQGNLPETIQKKLSIILQEVDTPFFFSPNKRYKTQQSIKKTIAHISSLNYNASTTQFGPNFIKTDCPWSLLDQVFV